MRRVASSTMLSKKPSDGNYPPFSLYIFRMRRFAYCKVVLATSLVWVMLDMFILLYFSECNKCDDKKPRGLPGRDGEGVSPQKPIHRHIFMALSSIKFEKLNMYPL